MSLTTTFIITAIIFLLGKFILIPLAPWIFGILVFFCVWLWVDDEFGEKPAPYVPKEWSPEVEWLKNGELEWLKNGWEKRSDPNEIWVIDENTEYSDCGWWQRKKSNTREED
jgi:hypothetical protein